MINRCPPEGKTTWPENFLLATWQFQVVMIYRLDIKIISGTWQHLM